MNCTPPGPQEAYLRSSGYEARTYDDKLFRYFLFLRPPRAVYHVQVKINRLADAVGLLAAGPPAVLKQAMRCPACESLRVNYPQMTRRFILPTVRAFHSSMYSLARFPGRAPYGLMVKPSGDCWCAST